MIRSEICFRAEFLEIAIVLAFVMGFDQINSSCELHVYSEAPWE